jgi:hypothetical protein
LSEEKRGMKMKREHRHVFSCIITERKAKQRTENGDEHA